MQHSKRLRYPLALNRRPHLPFVCQAAKDSKFINDGEPTPSLGEFATIAKQPKGAPLLTPTKYLQKVHLDIAFGDGLGWLGNRFALILVDQAIQYNWVIGVKSLHSHAIIAAFMQFRVEAGKLATHF